jgi:hypothetical protein
MLVQHIFAFITESVVNCGHRRTDKGKNMLIQHSISQHTYEHQWNIWLKTQGQGSCATVLLLLPSHK